jgi:SAM-dependent methyltransferase
LYPQAITSEIFVCEGINLVVDARKLPFKDASLRAIVMTDVMHHIPDAEHFFAEARRTVRPGGRIVMIEPWVSVWSKFVYTRFHPEPFLPEASTWSFPSSGPLSGANGAIPWIVFDRDIERFRRLFPELQVTRIERFMPFRYLLSGGVSLRTLMPGWSFNLWRALEGLLTPAMRFLAMFAFIQVDRR